MNRVIVKNYYFLLIRYFNIIRIIYVSYPMYNTRVYPLLINIPQYLKKMIFLYNNISLIDLGPMSLACGPNTPKKQDQHHPS